MFENFGLKDIWSNIKKFKYLLILFLAASVAFGYILYRRDKNNNHLTGDYFYVSSSYYNVKTKDVSENKVAIAQKNASTYQIMVKSDMANTQVFERLLESYSKEDLIKFFGMNVPPADLFPLSLENVFSCSLLQNTNTLNMYVKTKDEKLSSVILQYYNDFLKTNLQSSIEDDSLEYIGGANQKLKTENEPLPGMSIKDIILIFVLAVVLELLFVILYSFLHPTINDKSDFEKYGVHLFSSLK